MLNRAVYSPLPARPASTESVPVQGRPAASLNVQALADAAACESAAFESAALDDAALEAAASGALFQLPCATSARPIRSSRSRPLRSDWAFATICQRSVPPSVLTIVQ